MQQNQQLNLHKSILQKSTHFPNIPEGNFNNNKGDNEDNCLSGHSELKIINVSSKLGGMKIYANIDAFNDLTMPTLTSIEINRFVKLYNTYLQACNIVKYAIPTLSEFISFNVFAGYDSKHIDYKGFTIHGLHKKTIVIINLYSLMHIKKHNCDPLHQLIIIITHELAHVLEITSGHGILWRERHSSLLEEVYSKSVYFKKDIEYH